MLTKKRIRNKKNNVVSEGDCCLFNNPIIFNNDNICDNHYNQIQKIPDYNLNLLGVNQSHSPSPNPFDNLGG